MSNIHIQQGHLLDPAHGLDDKQDIFISQGKIVALGNQPDGFQADKVIDANGLTVIPGIVDLCASLREPGYKYKGTVASETRAASCGGITSIVCTPDTNPVIDTAAVVELIQHQAREAGFAKVYPLGALTAGLRAEQLSNIHGLQQAGCVAFSNHTHVIANSDLLHNCFKYAATFNAKVFYTARDSYLGANGCAHGGAISARLGLTGIPSVAEAMDLARVIQLVAFTGVHCHINKISTAESVQLIKQAKQQGLPITCDVSINNLQLTDMDIYDYDSNCHVQPPLRSDDHQQALKQGLADGSIDAICSDHQPHEQDAKLLPFAEAEPGISGFETLLPLALRLRKEAEMDIAKVVTALTHNPARIIGLESSGIAIGNPADLCVIDINAPWQLQADSMTSKGKNSPYLNWPLEGMVRHTVLDGEIAFSG